MALVQRARLDSIRNFRDELRAHAFSEDRLVYSWAGAHLGEPSQSLAIDALASKRRPDKELRSRRQGEQCFERLHELVYLHRLRQIFVEAGLHPPPLVWLRGGCRERDHRDVLGLGERS
jgi:hypothetical protein